MRCWVKSRNERNPYRPLLTGKAEDSDETAGRMSFHGGHRYQMFQSTHVPSFNPPSLGLLCDLIDLVDQIVHGKIVGRISNVDNIMELEPVLYAAYGRAEIQYKASNIRI